MSIMDQVLRDLGLETEANTSEKVNEGLIFQGLDLQGRVVFIDKETQKFYCMVDDVYREMTVQDANRLLKSHMETGIPGLHTKCNNHFEGEPDCPSKKFIKK